MRKIQLSILFLILFCFCKTTQAQINYVINPSFEQLKYVDTIFPWLNQVEKVWHGTDSTNDVWNAVVFYTYKNHYNMLPIPDVSWGGGGVYQYPRSGKVVICLTGFTDSLFSEQRYAVGQLNEKLASGHQYCVTLYSNLGKAITEGIANNHICAYIGNASIDTIMNSRGKTIHLLPQLICDSIVKDTQNWTKEQAAFIATGNETRIILGNFYYNYQTTVMTLGIGQMISDYFIDDVSVVESNAHIYAGNDTTINEDDTIVLGKGITDGLPCDWYLLNGTPVYRGSTPEVTPTTTTTYVAKMDLCGTITYDTMTVYVIPTGIVSLNNTYSTLTIFPNPTNSSFTINFSNDWNNAAIKVFNLTGQMIVEKQNQNGKQLSIDLSNQSAGIYFVEVQTATGIYRSKVVKE